MKTLNNGTVVLTREEYQELQQRISDLEAGEKRILEMLKDPLKLKQEIVHEITGDYPASVQWDDMAPEEFTDTIKFMNRLNMLDILQEDMFENSAWTAEDWADIVAALVKVSRKSIYPDQILKTLDNQ